MYIGNTHCGVELTGTKVFDCLSEREATVLFNHCVEPCFCINLLLIPVIKTIIQKNLERREVFGFHFSITVHHCGTPRQEHKESRSLETGTAA